MLSVVLYCCVFLAMGSYGQNVLPKYSWPVYHQRYLQTGYCEYSFLLSVQNSEGQCLLPANVSTRLQEIERERTVEEQHMKLLSTSLSKLSAQVHDLTLTVNATVSELTRLAAGQTDDKANYDDLTRDLANVTQKAETTRTQIGILHNEQRSTNLELLQTIEEQNQTIDELKALVRQQSHDLARLETLFQENIEVIQEQGQDLEEMKTLYEQQSDTISQYETRVARLEADASTSSPAVAFSAARTTPLGPVSGHTRVSFDRVYVNTGNSYNPDNGVFTCNTAGSYMFSFFMYKAVEVPEMAVYLVLNNTVVASSFEKNSKTDDEFHYSSDMSGNSLILNLDVGDTVSVVLRNGDYIFSANFDKYCTFSGFLLK